MAGAAVRLPAGGSVIEPVRLEGRLVVLEPVGDEHEEGLRRAGGDPHLWRWGTFDLSTSDGFEAWWTQLRRAADAGDELPWTTLDAATGEPLGSTRFLNIVPEHLRVEIGYTWIARSRWGTGANKEAKLLQLEYAFERLGYQRVEFKTDARNEESRRALAALPARFEGVFRKHMHQRYGVRDSAYYAITDDEWPAVKAGLLRRLEPSADRLA
jgi:RimJ/RimL family protein N-acetyltransferase